MTTFDKLMISTALVTLMLYSASKSAAESHKVTGFFAFISGLAVLALIARLPWIIF